MRAGLQFIVWLISFWCISGYASFDLAPIIASVQPSGSAATTSFTLTNPDDTRTPVQIAIYSREPDINGEEKYVENKEVEEMFQIFPSQVILNPKEKRTVRVTYVGDPKIIKELAFRIIAEEFPINVSDPGRVKDRAVASIAIASKYVGSLYVTPSGTKPELTTSAAANMGKKGNEMVLTMENKGTQHMLLKNPKIKFNANGKDYSMPQETLNKLGTQNILAGKTRKFTVPWPDGVPVGALKVTVEVSQK